MSYDADVAKVMDKFSSWARGAVIGDDVYHLVEDLVNRHRDDRARVFEDCINALKRDKDIQSPFDSACDKGLDLNERLRNAVEQKISYGGGYGFKEAGFSDFFDGEKYAWQACKGVRIGLIAEAMHDIEVNNVEIFKKLEEDLKNARSDEKVVDEQGRATFGEMRDSVRGAAVEVAGTLAALPVAMIPMIGKQLGPKIKAMVATLLGGTTRMQELSRKKGVAKGVIVGNSTLLDKAKAQIGDRAIEDIRKRADDLAHSWKDSARSGFNSDWEYFGKDCSDVLKEKAGKATEKAKKLFEEMGPLYRDAITKSFVSLLSDPSNLASLQDQLSADLQKIFEDLSKDNVVIASLRDSDPKKLAVTQMNEIMNDVTNGLKDLKEKVREIEERMKSS